MENNNKNLTKNYSPTDVLCAVKLVQIDPDYYFDLSDDFKNIPIIAIETIKKNPSFYPKLNDELKKNPKIILNAISHKSNLDHISIEYLKDKSDSFLYNFIDANQLVFKKIINDEFFIKNPNGIMKLSNILSNSINYGYIHHFTQFLEHIKSSDSIPLNPKSSGMLNHMIKNVTLVFLDKLESGSFFERHAYELDEADFEIFKKQNTSNLLNKIFSLIPSDIKDPLLAKEMFKIFPNTYNLLSLDNQNKKFKP